MQVVTQVDQLSTTIAGAVEEQTATTSEIGRNVAEAARGTSEIARNIGGVAEAASSSASAAVEVQTAADSLKGMAGELQALVGEFRLRADVGQAANDAWRPAASAKNAHGNGVANGHGLAHVVPMAVARRAARV